MERDKRDLFWELETNPPSLIDLIASKDYRLEIFEQRLIDHMRKKSELGLFLDASVLPASNRKTFCLECNLHHNVIRYGDIAEALYKYNPVMARAIYQQYLLMYWIGDGMPLLEPIRK